MILLGEMRDYETINIAMTAAETGHLLTEAFVENASAFMHEYYFHKRIVPENSTKVWDLT